MRKPNEVLAQDYISLNPTEVQQDQVYDFATVCFAMKDYAEACVDDMLEKINNNITAKADMLEEEKYMG